MEHVKLKHYARPDEVSDPEWGQALEVSAKYLAKKLENKKHGGAFDASNFNGIPASEHFSLQAFDKLFTGQCKWSEHRALHTQIIRIALSDMSHHLRDWMINDPPPETVELDERLANRLKEDEDFMDIVYEEAQEAVAGEQDLLDYLKSMRRCDDYELIGEELGIPIQEVYQRQRKLMRRIEKRKAKARAKTKVKGKAK